MLGLGVVGDLIWSIASPRIRDLLFLFSIVPKRMSARMRDILFVMLDSVISLLRRYAISIEKKPAKH
jgi:hypothetical protein